MNYFRISITPRLHFFSTKYFCRHATRIVIISLALIVFCQLLIPLSEGVCFSLKQSEGTPLLIRENAPPQTPQSALTIQDNLNIYSPANTSGALLLPVSDNFVSADIIDSNLPIFSQFRHPSILPQDPFANLLYANLRIKKLLQEYAEVQERAKELLHGSYQSGAIEMMSKNSINTLKIKLSKNENQENKNLFNTLKQLQLGLATVITAEYINKNTALNLSTNTQTSKNTIISFNQLQTAQNSKIELSTRATSNKSVCSIPISNSQSRSSSVTSSVPPSQLGNAKFSCAGSYEAKLPWILDLPFKLFDFFLAHKIIFLIAAFSCLGILNLVFGSRS